MERKRAEELKIFFLIPKKKKLSGPTQNESKKEDLAKELGSGHDS